MKKTVLILIITGVLSKIFGFGRYITLANYYGASNISDAYLIALTIPMTIFQFIGQGISTTFIPIYSSILTRNGNDSKKAQSHLNNLINILFLICTAAILISILTAPLLVRLFASGFDHDTFTLAVNLTRITLLGIYFSVLMRILTGYLHVCRSYIIPGLIGLPFNTIIIISIIVSSRTNVYILAIGTLLAMFSEFLMILYASYKEGYRYRPVFSPLDPGLLKTLRLAFPTIISTSVKDINRLVDRTLASRTAIGGISALSYATRLTYFIQQTYVTALITVMYPLISEMASKDDINSIKKSLSQVINAVNLILIPATIGALLFAKPFVELFFKRGAFDLSAVSMTSTALIFYCIGMLSLGHSDILSRVFFSLQDTLTPVKISTLGMAVNIILNFILIRYLGLGGLALATSISSILTASLLFIALRNKIGCLGMRNLSSSFIKMLFSALIMGAIAHISFNTLSGPLPHKLSLIISVLSGALIYFTLIYFLKIEDVDSITKTLKKRLSERQY